MKKVYIIDLDSRENVKVLVPVFLFSPPVPTDHVSD